MTCWKGYERVPGTKEFSKGSCRKKKFSQKKKSSKSKSGVKRSSSKSCTPGKNKKFAKIVNGKCVRFGDPNMTIKKNDPGRKRSFCARHKCSEKNDPATPGYQSCRKWSC